MRTKELKKKGFVPLCILYYSEAHYIYNLFFNGRWEECKCMDYITDLFGITVLNLMGGVDFYEKYIICKSAKEMMFLKDKLNSEQVKKYEPENWQLPTWKATYKRTHK